MAQPGKEDFSAQQDLSVGNINPSKLVEKLRLTFGSGRFKIAVCISAQENLFCPLNIY